MFLLFLAPFLNESTRNSGIVLELKKIRCRLKMSLRKGQNSVLKPIHLSLKLLQYLFPRKYKRKDNVTNARKGKRGKRRRQKKGRTHGRTERWMDELIDEKTDGRKNEWMKKWMDGWTHGLKDDRMDGQKDGRTKGRMDRRRMDISTD